MSKLNKQQTKIVPHQTLVLPVLWMICLRVIGRPSNTGLCQKTSGMPLTWLSPRRSIQTFGINFGFSTTKSTSSPQFSMTESPVTNRDGTKRRKRCWRRSFSAKSCCLKRKCAIWKRRLTRKQRAQLM